MMLILKIILCLLGVIFLSFALFITWLWWVSQKQPPSYAVIEQKYYVCREYKLLEGGIFGKGPKRKFHGEKDWCWRNEWEEITKDEFKQLASDWYGVDWSKETPFWQDKDESRSAPP